MPERLRLLEQWLGDACGLHPFQLEPASSDASFRRYFRVTLVDGSTRIAMDAPPPAEDCRPFLAVAARMAEAGLHVPAIFGADIERGFLLLEDLGDTSYLSVLDDDNVAGLYGDATDALLRLQRDAPVEGLPPYDRALLLREVALFPEWLLARHLDMTLDDDERSMLSAVFEALIDSALAQPRVCVHRDFHSRNLMRVDADNPGVIDFQDAVAGPATYDLVSLLRDCYVAWPGHRVDAWVFDYLQRAQAAGMLRGVLPDTFLRWFDLMGVQRHLKAVGIFARLNHRDGKPGYLADIPRTLKYIVDVGRRRREIAELAHFVAERVFPRL